MTNGEKFKEVFGFGADGSRVIAVNATWWDCEFQNSNKPITNADLIRRKDDEELADFIARQRFCTVNPIADKLGIDVTTAFIVCRESVLDWLKQEAEA